jgi:hypothetical protein
MSELFRCAVCLGTFKKAWTDEEAKAEYVAAFPIESQMDPQLDLVCDDCYLAMTTWKPPSEYEAERFDR